MVRVMRCTQYNLKAALLILSPCEWLLVTGLTMN